MEGTAQFPEACEQGKRSDFILSIAEGNDFLKEMLLVPDGFTKGQPGSPEKGPEGK